MSIEKLGLPQGNELGENSVSIDLPREKLSSLKGSRRSNESRRTKEVADESLNESRVNILDEFKEKDPVFGNIVNQDPKPGFIEVKDKL